MMEGSAGDDRSGTDAGNASTPNARRRRASVSLGQENRPERRNRQIAKARTLSSLAPPEISNIPPTP